jgi:predicted phosphate transport protein (TIGR00153 family)
MRPMRNILSWLGDAQAGAMMKTAELHVEETCKTVAFLSEAVKARIAGDLAGADVAIHRLKESERQADLLRAKMVTEAFTNLLSGPDREDLLRFANSLDKIANATLRAGRILSLIEKPLPERVWSNMAVGVELIVKGMGCLDNAIRSLSKNRPRETLASCVEVERCEHEADDQKRTMLVAVLHADLNAATMLLCYNLAEALEVTTDRMANVSDMLKLFALRAS